MALEISGFTSFANIDPSCIGQVTQPRCSSGVLTAALGVFCVQNISRPPWRLSEQMNRAVLVLWSLTLVLCNFFILFFSSLSLHHLGFFPPGDDGGEWHCLFLLITETNGLSVSCCHKLCH